MADRAQHRYRGATRTEDADAWQVSQLHREFDEILARPARQAASVRLPDVTALLSRHLAGRPTRANFRTGTLTVCTMVPMRSVPPGGLPGRFGRHCLSADRRRRRDDALAREPDDR